jgi:putative polyhydroxyalkanoate system protein
MSKPVVVSIPHQLGRAEARRRIDEGVGRLTQQFAAMGEVKHAWSGDTLNFNLTSMGQEVTGKIDIADQDVRLEVVLPGFLAMIANKVRGRLQKEGQILLENKSKG